jgi:hypothetical protein
MDALVVARVFDLAIQIQQIPAPTFEESQRAEFIQSNFNIGAGKYLRMSGQCLRTYQREERCLYGLCTFRHGFQKHRFNHNAPEKICGPYRR